MNTVSENLKRIRQERNLTQQQMADKLFVTQQAVSNWEKGKTMPGVDMLVDIAEKLDVEIYELLYSTNNDNKSRNKKVKIMRTISVILIIVFVLSYIKGVYVKQQTFNLEIYWFARIFVFPVMLFTVFYSCMLFAKTKLKLRKNKYPIVTHFIQISILIFMFLTITLYIWVMFFKLTPRPDIFFDIWHIIAQQPWVYGLAGIIYGIVEEREAKNKKPV